MHASVTALTSFRFRTVTQIFGENTREPQSYGDNAEQPSVATIWHRLKKKEETLHHAVAPNFPSPDSRFSLAFGLI